MSNKVKQIYSLIQKDLKEEGWDEDAISEAIAECIKERRATGADENTICVTELSYLSKASLDLLTKNRPIEDKSIGGHKKSLLNLARVMKSQNWRFIVGVLFLIMPVISAFYAIYDLFFDADILSRLYRFDIVARLAIDQYEYHGIILAISVLALLLYLGLMAIAGAILIRGSCFKKEK